MECSSSLHSESKYFNMKIERDFFSGGLKVFKISQKIYLTILGALWTGSVAFMAMAVNAHDAPEMFFRLFKVASELAFISISPMFFGGINAVVCAALKPLSCSEDESVSDVIAWFGGFSVALVVSFLCGSYAFSTKTIETLVSNPIPKALEEEFLCASHNIASYKYPGYTPPDVISSLNCNSEFKTSIRSKS